MHVESWYVCMKTNVFAIISASMRFLLKEIIILFWWAYIVRFTFFTRVIQFSSYGVVLATYLNEVLESNTAQVLQTNQWFWELITFNRQLL